MPDRIRPRGDTAANWTSANPVLQDREIGLETDTRRYKIGDGTTAWNSLSYNQIGDRYYTLSSTTETIGNGAKTFTVSAGLAYTPQQAVQIVATAAPANHMHGTVTSYSGTTLVVQVDKNTGAGSFSSWTINVGGVTGAALSSISIVAGNGLSGGGTLDASRTVQLAVLSPSPAGTFGSTSQLAALGVNIFGQVISASAVDFTAVNIQAFSSSGTWTKPTNAKRVKMFLMGGGGGGGGGAVTLGGSTISCGGGGGGSGGITEIEIPADQLTSTVSVTIGAGGTGGFGPQTQSASLSGSAGGVGNPTFFGSYAWAQGGGSGGAGLSGTFGTPTGTGGASSSGGNTGGAASTTGGSGTVGTPGSATSSSTVGSGGGGAGGSCNTAATASAGGAGGRANVLNLTGGSGGVTGGGNGGAGQSATTSGPSGGIVRASGGGGGGSVSTGTSGFIAGFGGAGGVPGGGGGGGGAIQGLTAGFYSAGSGGAGGAGYAVITTYFY